MIKNLLMHLEKLAVIGLGYVGMPLAVEFAEKMDVIGFDTNANKIQIYKNGIDPTNEVGNERIRLCKIDFTSDEKRLDEASWYIIAVPTPIYADKTPDLNPVVGASEIVGRHLKKGSIIVYESTVYPGLTESVCIPLLEKLSGLKCGEDFFVGYSPERINPADKVHTLRTIKKIVSGIDAATCTKIAALYELIIDAGVYPVSSIKVAEAAKVAENSQRDINIAFMNELALSFDKMGIDTNEVVDAMNTKWNALGFRPGLVGGHCIGVDPYYFIYEAEKQGYHSQIMSASRKINDDMGVFIGNSAVKQMILADKKIKGSKIAILGITFKENCPDIRNSKVIDIYHTLKTYEADVVVCDEYASSSAVKDEYGFNLTPFDNLKDLDCIIIAVAHKEYREMNLTDFSALCNPSEIPVIIDVKALFHYEDTSSCQYWCL